ncbi:MAG: FecR family protein [Tannerella sp.]|jgi:ferric-dicitrate binding protein FerR (iron transport regulator)|nr:FecR family protein [Tannerella sp.]
MKNSSLKDLLKVFMFGKITPEDFSRLKESAIHSSEKELDDEIKSIWDEMADVAPIDKKIKDKILKRIHRQIYAGTKRTFYSWMKIAAVILFPLFVSLGAYLYFSKKYQPVPEDVFIMTERGQKTKILLPDGTRVWLNSDSKLNYTSGFKHNGTKVKLEGEAFFEVGKRAGTSFTVGTGCVNVIVHGTAFNVSAYDEDSTVNVSLLRGHVSLAYSSDNTLITELYPNQKASVSKENGKWQVRSCDAEIESLWIQNKLKFENAPATEVFRKLERWYGVNISVENMNEEILYGFTLKSESLREILYEINKITPIIYKINGEEVSVTYK